ncbi:DUF2442 domain-containing protein [Anabaena subtropica]|uniref:DUF2442 domain-containing protein n=1 Tax=Anabaena subtropica FACHB-260 TaxID=2692884 RepID=A0ABR8CYB0_9NOST|nr:DUF2442 domain-containing protein [Anabaena subtropica]MBD2346785.1 DUF2442 domain-containing protein [Anabaena subtropica FACHB-260]
MLKDIIAVEPIEDYKLYIKFEDNQQGVIDISKLISFTGIFAPLQNIDYFKQVKINPEWGTIYWENGADFDPDVLYAEITGEAINNYQIAKT